MKKSIVLFGLLMVGIARADLTDKLETRCTELEGKIYSTALTWEVTVEMSQDFYFYGHRCATTDKDRMDWHDRGLQMARQSLTTLTTSDAPEKWAMSHYFAGVNLSRWALANGARASLSRWGEVEEHLEGVIKYDPTIIDYGVHRIYGRAYYKLPGLFGGSYRKSRTHLKEAYDNTIHSTFNTSSNVLTTLYYLSTLYEQGDDTDFCEIYDDFTALMPMNEQKAMELNPNRVLETLLDMEMFNNPPEEESWIVELKEHFDVNC